MKTVTSENIGEILQHMYDSEIHLWLGWLWDGGIEYTLNPAQIIPNQTCSRNIAEALSVVVDDVLDNYPNSEFARWWKS
jgi:hypothetical protein